MWDLVPKENPKINKYYFRKKKNLKKITLLFLQAFKYKVKSIEA